jgi:hypothetical protein
MAKNLGLVYVLAVKDEKGIDATIRSNVVDVINANIRAGIAWDVITASKLTGRGSKGGFVEPIIRQLCKWYKGVSREEVLRKYKRWATLASMLVVALSPLVRSPCMWHSRQVTRMRRQGRSSFDGSNKAERSARSIEKANAARERKVIEAYTKEDKDLKQLRSEWQARMDSVNMFSPKWEEIRHEYQVAEDAFWTGSMNPLRRGPINYMC